MTAPADALAARYTRDQLRVMCRTRGLPTGGTKAQLAGRLVGTDSQPAGVNDEALRAGEGSLPVESQEGVLPSAPAGYYTTFTRLCRDCEETVSFVDSVQQPHECSSPRTVASADAARVATTDRQATADHILGVAVTEAIGFLREHRPGRAVYRLARAEISARRVLGEGAA